MKNRVQTVVLLGALSAILIGVGAAISPQALLAFTILAMLVNLGMYFFSDRLVLKMHGAREVSEAEAPMLHAIVNELCARAGLPKPRISIIPSIHPNAFATGRNPRNAVVAVTEGVVHLLDRRELRAVIGHELAHVGNRDILVSTMAAGLAGAVAYVANIVQFSAIFGGSDGDDDSAAPSLAFAFVAPIVATLVQLGISRSREYLADEHGAEISGDPEALARALEKLESAAVQVPPAVRQPATASLFIVNPLTGVGGMARLFSTHPPTHERVRRLRAHPYGREGIAA